MDNQLPSRITVKRACAVIGGDKPINESTYYRGVKDGRYPAPKKVSPNISRIDTAELLAALAK